MDTNEVLRDNSKKKWTIGGCKKGGKLSMFRAVGTAGPGGTAPPPFFDRSVNHISKRGGRLSTPHY